MNRSSARPGARPVLTRLWPACVLAFALAGAPVDGYQQAGQAPERRTVRLDHFGISITPPAGAITTTRRVEGAPVTAMKLPDGLGKVAIRRQQASDGAATAAAVERFIAAGLLGLGPDEPLAPAAFEGTEKGRLLQDVSRLTIAGAEARALYVKLAREDEAEPAVVRGFAVVPRREHRFLVFELITDEDALPRARGRFEALLSSVSSRALRRGSPGVERALDAGLEALVGLGPSDYDAVVSVHAERLERVYRPASRNGGTDDDRELGYRRVRIWAGNRGELDDTPREYWNAADEQRGWLMRIESRLFLPGGADARDVTAMFLSRDHRRESWSQTLAVTPEGRRQPEVWRQFATRHFDEMRVIVQPGDPRGIDGTALDSASSAMPGGALPAVVEDRIITPDVRLEGYISRLEVALLPLLLRRAQAEGDLAFYAYDERTETVDLHGVQCTASEEGGATMSMLRPGGGRVRTVVGPDGSLARSVTGDGTVIEPIDPDELRRLYRRKGLPTD